MPLPDGFPSKEVLEKEGLNTIEDVCETSDVELLELEGIGPVTLDKIRSVAPFRESPDATGPGETSGKTAIAGVVGPATSADPTSESYVVQTSKKSKDQSDPITGEKLPEGITKNERGTLTASSTVDQADMVSPEQVKLEREAALKYAGAKIAALLNG